MEKVKCGDCRHWRYDEIFTSVPKTDDDLGTCAAMDEVVLPHSWRYCKRERLGCWRGEEIECPRFEQRER